MGTGLPRVRELVPATTGTGCLAGLRVALLLFRIASCRSITKQGCSSRNNPNWQTRSLRSSRRSVESNPSSVQVFKCDICHIPAVTVPGCEIFVFVHYRLSTDPAIDL